jgi:hypothetical protein
MKGRKFQEYLYESRDAYIVMKIKIFSSQGDRRGSDKNTFAAVLGVLEGIEIYSDIDRRTLLYSESYRKRHSSKSSQVEEKLKEQYEAQKAQKALEILIARNAKMQDETMQGMSQASLIQARNRKAKINDGKKKQLERMKKKGRSYVIKNGVKVLKIDKAARARYKKTLKD